MKNVLITGSSSGLGRSMYDFFKHDLQFCTIGVGRKGPDLFMDLSLLSDRELLFTELKKLISNVDILVNNAGVIILDEGILQYEECLSMIQLNLVAVWDLILRTKCLMKNGGSIINIASISGMKESSDIPLYGAVKAGVISLTKSFAKKFAECGIRVNSISPGFFNSELVPGDLPEEFLQLIPLGREAECNEILPVVRMLLESNYITGSNIVIDGGVLG